MNDMCLILKEMPVTEEPGWVELWAMSLIMHTDFSGPFPALVSFFKICSGPELHAAFRDTNVQEVDSVVQWQYLILYSLPNYP